MKFIVAEFEATLGTNPDDVLKAIKLLPGIRYAKFFKTPSDAEGFDPDALTADDMKAIETDWFLNSRNEVTGEFFGVQTMNHIRDTVERTRAARDEEA